MRSTSFKVMCVVVGVLTVQLLMGDNWTSYGHDPQHSGASLDTILSTSNASQLVKHWSFRTGAPIYASATVSNSAAFVGSWDGYEYALTVNKGTVIWKQFLGKTTGSRCFSSIGVSSTAAVDGATLYVGGGDGYWYALNAATGAILWKILIGDNNNGNYNWASPLIYNGFAYVGVASGCDKPLVQGQLLQVSLSTHQIVNTFDTVPPGVLGASIWSSPAVDPATNTIYVTTGNEKMEPSIHPYAEAMVALDASTLQVKGSWQVPPSQIVLDSDFGGSSPVLFSDSSGHALVGAINKNGYLYAFDRTNVSAGPLWERPVATGGVGAPEQGDGSVATGAFANGTLFMAGGNTSINGSTYQGSIRALDPATGNVEWEHGVPGLVIGNLVYDNGLIIDAASTYLEVLDASTGNRLFSWQDSAQIYELSVAEGKIFVSSTDGSLYTFGLPFTSPPPTPTPVPDPNCPSGYTCQDIGNPTPAGSDSTSGSTISVTGGGPDINGISDHFRFVWQPITGNVQVSSQVLSITGPTTLAKAGIMVRQSSSQYAPYYGVFLVPAHGFLVQYRIPSGSTITAPLFQKSNKAPLYLEIQRVADRFVAASSSDGITYTLIPGSQATVVMPANVLSGLAVTSHSSTSVTTATFTNVAMGVPGAPPVVPPPPIDSNCPSGWSCSDIGSFAPAGSESPNGNGWTVTGAGVDMGGLYSTPKIGSNYDEFHFMWQSLSGNGTITTQVISQSNTNPWAKAGIMLRDSSDPGAMYYAVYVTPGNYIAAQYRTLTGYFNRVAWSTPGGPPKYLRISRQGNTFTASISSDGINWTVITSSAQTIAMGTTVLAGLAVTSWSPGVLGSGAFGPVTITSGP